MEKSEFQFHFNSTTGLFSMSSIGGSLLSRDFKITVPAGSVDTQIQMYAPSGFNIVEVTTSIVTGADSPAEISVTPGSSLLPLFKFNVGNRDISLSIQSLEAQSVTFVNTNGPGGTVDVGFSVFLALQRDGGGGPIYRTRDPQIEDIKEGGS